MPGAVPSADLIDTFAGIMRLLITLLMQHGAIRGVPAPFLLELREHVAALGRNVVAVLRRMADGTLRRQPAQHAPRPSVMRRPPTVFRTLPRGWLWLVRVVQETMSSGYQLQACLDQQDLPAMFAAAPQLRRALLPLATMLGVKLPKAAPALAPAPASSPWSAQGSRACPGSAPSASGLPAPGATAPERLRTFPPRAPFLAWHPA